MLSLSSARLTAAGSVAAITLFTTAAAASAHVHHHNHWRDHHSGGQLTASVVLDGTTLTHAVSGGTAHLTQPDDITHLGDRLFVGFQNGVGSQGEAASSGNTDSTIVEFDRGGHVLGQWDVVGKVDGLGADPETGQVLATVNEDGNSSLYTIDPESGSAPVHYQYSQPLPSGGGTDGISVYHGTIMISASAPGNITTAPSPANYPAVYEVWLDPSSNTAFVNGIFSDGSPAQVANTNASNYGSWENLALTDPDSNEVVPSYAQRFGGAFMLTSQGDQEQIFYSETGQPLSVLSLSQSVDDTGWPSGPDSVAYATDGSADKVIAVSGPFQRGSEIAAVTPCNANSAPSSCPGPGYPANYLGSIDPNTGTVTPLTVAGVSFTPKGLLFLGGDGDNEQ